jgi:beta-mannosidase
MPQRISLDGEWELTWMEYGGTLASPPPTFHNKRIAGTVPGDVHLDLARAGILPDLFVGTNADAANWVERKDWWYSCEFETPLNSEGKEALLVFHGLDCFATVWLNGELVGKSDNMFIRHEFPVTGKLNPRGANRVVVRLASPAFSIKTDPGHKPLVWSPERLFCRKAQMSFGWDIAPRIMTTGIWRPVELVLVDTARISNVRVRTWKIEEDLAILTVETEVEWLAPDSGTGRVQGRIGKQEWTTDLALNPGFNTTVKEVMVENPQLWWPLGYGEQNLCDVTVQLEVDDKKVDRYEGTTGIRLVELVQEPQPSGATSFFFRCNGRDIFITGLNWTPLDAIFARITPEKTTKALELIAELGCNMVRVWGGGIYDGPHFYDECDRLGILVWQDFMMACGWYPQTDEFGKVLATEARQVVRDLRNHPSIAIWAGDNENDAFYPELVKDNRMTRQVLAGVCDELDPDRPYVPSSPYSPSGGDPNGATDGDWHGYAHGEDYHVDWIWNLKARFVSEFGHLSLPSLDLIRKYFPAGTEWPLTGPVWRYHSADTIRYDSFRGPDRILKSLKAGGKPDPRDITEAVNASQELQAEAVGAWIERYCLDPEFGGFMLWNVSDCWPQQSDAVTDYDLTPKLVCKKLAELFGRLRREHQTILIKK